MAAPFAYIACAIVHESGRLTRTPLNSPYPAFIAVMCVAVVFGLIHSREEPGAARTRNLVVADVTAAVLMAVGAVLLALSVARVSAALRVVGIELVGAGVAWMYLRWGRVFRSMPLRDAAVVICQSVVVASVMKAMALGLPTVAWAVFMCVLACAALASLCEQTGSGSTTMRGEQPCADARRTLDVSAQAGVTLAVKDLVAISIAFMVLSALLGCLYNTTRSGSDVRPMLLGYAVEALGAIAAWLWVGRLRKSLDAAGIMATLGLLVGVGLLLLSLAGDAADAAFFIITNIDHSLLTLFLWVCLTAIARQTVVSPGVIFGAGWTLRSLPFFIAGMLTRWTGLSLAPSLFYLLFFTLLAVVLALVGDNVGVRSLFAPLRPSVREDGLTVERRCADVAVQAGLTPRELEVLTLLCHGRSRPYIAETLYLSENTVRGYTKAIYKKLGVHDRQSLFDLVDGVHPPNRA